MEENGTVSKPITASKCGIFMNLFVVLAITCFSSRLCGLKESETLDKFCEGIVILPEMAEEFQLEIQSLVFA